MHGLNRLLGVLAIAVGLAGLGITGAATAADVIKERQADFKDHSKNTKAIKAAVDAGNPGDAVAPAEAMVVFANKIPSLFPEGSAGDSRAKDTIWSDWDGFVKAANANAAAAQALAVKAQTGTAAEVGALLKAVGKTCGECHDTYRLPKS